MVNSDSTPLIWMGTKPSIAAPSSVAALPATAFRATVQILVPLARGPPHEFHSGPSTEKHANIHSSKTRKEAICKTLRAALPSYDDITATFAENGGWWDSFRQKTRAISQAEMSESLLSFASHAFTSNNPAQVATLVVAYARSVGNSSQLISLVDNLVISDVSLAATVEGMECLILLGKTYTDVGQPRRAWLTWRKGIATAQLMASTSACTGGQQGILINLAFRVCISSNQELQQSAKGFGWQYTMAIDLQVSYLACHMAAKIHM
ncbi:hypothetical protein VFPPC_16501 [Pochonia chlamydosporia 170]|uniref:Uncharacterized protein n=1 Tax=Pochonia chlamydosporia 170 TaxID=1380566 RepID=A0A179FDS9_METCM|nr:hypothetical protein VFPPC_16501 [Pochonia chlamydosporia 170]OAQ63664.1 hypothetical protein VFPPC_16501 [Pochonia chlamydosporia 170]